MAAAPAPCLLRFTLAVVVAIAALALAPNDSGGSAPVTATVAGSVKKPPSEKRRSKLAARRAAKRPVKARPPRAAASPATPNDPLWSSSWSLAKTRVPAAWTLTAGAPETVVAVLDTGVDLSHPDLQGSFVPGHDAVNDDADPNDDHGHGTMVAGVIAARGNNGLGGVGVCSSCSLMPVKVIAGNGSGSVADIAEGIRWASDHGAHILNMSFALSGADDDVAQAIDYAQKRGVLVVAAAGNAGTGDVTFPAAYSGVLSVAATDAADKRYDWSSYGGWVRFAAPGCSVSTAAGGGYGDFCGTSSATALVSGIGGLMRSLAPTATTGVLEHALSANALTVGDFVSAGRVDVAAAMGSLKAERPATVPAEARTGEQPSRGVSSE